MTPPMSKTTALGVFSECILVPKTAPYLTGGIIECSETVAGSIDIPYRAYAS